MKGSQTEICNESYALLFTLAVPLQARPVLEFGLYLFVSSPSNMSATLRGLAFN